MNKMTWQWQWHVVKVPRSQRVKSKSCDALDEHSLLISPPHQPNKKNKIKNHHHHHYHHPPPRGFVGVYVGPHQRRFVIPTTLLAMPDFQALMDLAAEEFGYEQQGGLRIPCDEDYFRDLLSKFNSNSSKSCYNINIH